MKKIYLFILSSLLFTSCDYLEELTTKKVERNEPIIASVYDANLYLSDVEGMIPNDLSVKDSLVFIKGYINTWAKQQLLLKKAEENISDVSSKQLDSLVKTYRETLYINGYKDRLIKQKLDTVVSEEEVFAYYMANKDNFRLVKPIFQLKYIYFSKDLNNRKEILKNFESDKEEDLEALEEQTINFKDYHLRDSTWLTNEDLYKKVPPLKEFSEEELLKLSKIIEEEDSLGVYLINIIKVLPRSDIAPMQYIAQQIRRLILHKRKIELTRKIEKTLIDDAIKNGTFKEF